MQNTIKRTRPLLCPMTRLECMKDDCALYDEERRLCGLDALSLYSSIREAATDAAVEVIRAYREG